MSVTKTCRPVLFSFPSDNEPPIEKVIKAKEMDSSGSVCPTKVFDMIPKISGFKTIPARI